MFARDGSHLHPCSGLQGLGKACASVNGLCERMEGSTHLEDGLDFGSNPVANGDIFGPRQK